MAGYRQGCASYLGSAISNIDELVELALRDLDKVEFDGLVGTGLSGTVVVPVLAYLMKKRFAIVRKKDDMGHHSSEMVESGLHAGDRWIFVDDFTFSGNTRKRVLKEISKHHGELANGAGKLTYVGDYLYSNHDKFRRAHSAEVNAALEARKRALSAPMKISVADYSAGVPCHD
ncbi:MAG TPA: hypothetical protein ENH62_05835 [Marinobacter sp.]|uniref:Phosphoribosyltransferase domain-containing protein n=1 Tax=marine sediment metagenome TaxID=412755 RepID=A0A0F9VRM8_9ZZZZ|nr:hypothetical protein [Marinobacter sp.]